MVSGFFKKQGFLKLSILRLSDVPFEDCQERLSKYRLKFPLEYCTIKKKPQNQTQRTRRKVKESES
jgi:hypothetical protein